MSGVQAVLACEQCTRRKRQCDKTSPCSSCQQAGLICTTIKRSRLPRGSTAPGRQRNRVASECSSVSDRMSRLERMVSELQRSSLPHIAERFSPHASMTTDISAPPLSMPQPEKHNYIAPDFWALLSDEMDGLRETLELPDD